jgi:hypothetical protein
MRILDYLLVIVPNEKAVAVDLPEDHHHGHDQQ